MLEKDEDKRITIEELKKDPFFNDVNWKHIEKRTHRIDEAWVPPVLAPVSDAVISKRVLLEGKRRAEIPSGTFTSLLKVPRVIRPKVNRGRYGFKLDVQRGCERVEQLWLSRPDPMDYLPQEELRDFLGLRSTDIINEMTSLSPSPPTLVRSVSPPMTPPPRTPSPPQVVHQRPEVKRWEVPRMAVNSYSHCFM